MAIFISYFPVFRKISSDYVMGSFFYFVHSLEYLIHKETNQASFCFYENIFAVEVVREKRLMIQERERIF